MEQQWNYQDGDRTQNDGVRSLNSRREMASPNNNDENQIHNLDSRANSIASISDHLDRIIGDGVPLQSILNLMFEENSRRDAMMERIFR